MSLLRETDQGVGEMPAPEYRDRFQAAVLWRATGNYDSNGVLQVGMPEEVRVQWTDELKEQQLPDGSTVTLAGSAKVWLPPSQELPIGSHMWVGTLRDWYSQGSSGDDTEVRVVVSRNRQPDPKNRNQGWKVGLQRWKSRG